MNIKNSDPARTPWETDDAYSIKRHGISISNCDTEPVQTPGCVQNHGVLLVLNPNTLRITQVSENCGEWLGHTTGELLGSPIAIVLGESRAGTLADAVCSAPLQRNPTYLFTLPAQGSRGALDVIVHQADELLIVECEAAVTAGSGERDSYPMLNSAVLRLQQATDLRSFCDLVTREVRTLTGFDRVMVYRFHPDFHGEVFAESRNDDLTPFLGLHYPKEDIPAPARQVFGVTWIRPTPDVGSPVHEMVPLLNPDTRKPVLMTHCGLRGASVMYTEYLHNMGVTAGLTMSIRRGDTLWGLIACHHYSGPRPIGHAARAACELFAQVVSLQLQSAEARDQLVYRLKMDEVHRAVIGRAAQSNRLENIVEGVPSLLDGIRATGIALLHAGRIATLGVTPEEHQLRALAEWVATQAAPGAPRPHVIATDQLAKDCPAAASAGHATGVLAVPLSSNRRSLLLWFRPETRQTVTWAGDPTNKPQVVGPHGPRLTPRASFDLFVESVRGRSLPWKDVELQAADQLRQQLMELVVSRAEELDELNAQLTRSNEELDAFAYVASHDLKEPLRGIYKYAHQLLERAQADLASRDKLESLMRLTGRMDGLLDALLHYSRVGRTTLVTSPVAVDELLDEALEMLSGRNLTDTVQIRRVTRLPVLDCDPVRVREILVNLISNALKYNRSEPKVVEIGCVESQGRSLFVRDNGIGIEARHHGDVFTIFRRLHGREEYGGGSGAGLTIVKRLVEMHGGRIWIESTPGEGSTFYFTLEPS